MSEDSEIQQAAASAAAAGVAAVQDDQAEQQRSEAMEVSAEVASGSAAAAAEQAEAAADIATEAATAAIDATSQAAEASATAEAAAGEAYDARAHVEQLRGEFSAGLTDLRDYIKTNIIDTRGEQSSAEPQEVTVTHDTTTETEHSDTRSSTSTEPGSRPRHRFGGRRT